MCLLNSHQPVLNPFHSPTEPAVTKITTQLNPLIAKSNGHFSSSFHFSFLEYLTLLTTLCISFLCWLWNLLTSPQPSAHYHPITLLHCLVALAPGWVFLSTILGTMPRCHSYLAFYKSDKKHFIQLHKFTLQAHLDHPTTLLLLKFPQYSPLFCSFNPHILSSPLSASSLPYFLPSLWVFLHLPGFTFCSLKPRMSPWSTTSHFFFFFF